MMKFLPLLWAVACQPVPVTSEPGWTLEGGPQSDRFPGFSWLIQGELAGMPQPGRYGDLLDDLDFLADEGVTLVVTVNEYPPAESALEKVGLDGAYWPVEDMHAPQMNQLLEYVEVLEERRANGEPVAVHCTAGMGRTGTFLAAWLVWEGAAAQDAIDEVRRVRPGSIESVAQEESIHVFEEWIGRR